MSMDLLLALIAGAAAGAGVWFVVRELVPGQPDLAAAQARMSGADQVPLVDLASSATFKGKVGATVTARVKVPSLRF
ncbi:MAG: hypothetical protein FWE61_05295, partial [Micrococcales bacterium]|nr:hypothetical protein [Micrococcales bacterium]